MHISNIHNTKGQHCLYLISFIKLKKIILCKTNADDARSDISVAGRHKRPQKMRPFSLSSHRVYRWPGSCPEQDLPASCLGASLSILCMSASQSLNVKVKLLEMQTTISIYRMDKQQGPTVEHRELHSISRDKP